LSTKYARLAAQSWITILQFCHRRTFCYPLT